jgi:anti-sigma B factor antagonist
MTYTPASLVFHAEPACDRTVLHVTGEIDMATAPQLRDEANHWLVLGTGDLHLDLSGVTFADSSAVEVLLATRARAQAAGAELILRAVPRAVTRLLGLTSTVHVFHLAPAEDETPAA